MDGEAAELRVRRASADDAAGIAAVLNRIIEGGRHSLLDTPFSEAEERRFIASLPARAFIHAAVTPAEEIAGFQTVEPWNSFVTHEFDHVATMGTYVAQEFRRCGVGAALAAASFAVARAAGYEKIFTDLRADNLDSLCYHLSLGFRVVGTARGHARLRGHEIDVVFIEAFL